MRNTVRRLAPRLVFVASLAALASCERSQDVGWAERERPDSSAARPAEATSPTPVPSEQAQPGSPTAILQEYQWLVMALDTLRQRAMEDEVLAAEWRGLRAAVEARIAEGSEFHRKLIARRAEIEARLAESQETGEPIAQQELQELARNYSNIQAEFNRARNRLLEEDPGLSARARALQGRTFDKMRELAPGRAAEIDRVRELEDLIFYPPESLAGRPGTARVQPR